MGTLADMDDYRYGDQRRALSRERRQRLDEAMAKATRESCERLDRAVAAGAARDRRELIRMAVLFALLLALPGILALVIG